MKISTLRNAISIALLVVAAGTIEQALAEETATAPARTSTTGPQMKTDFDLPAGKLAAALVALGVQSDLQVNYPPALVANRQARAVRGHMSWHDALTRLLDGSGLTYKMVNSRTVAIQREAGQERAAGSPTVASSAPGATRPEHEIANLESVQVTGTRIRGGTTPSPVITIGSEQIQQEGFTDLGQVIRSVPQNFSGGQNPGVINGAVGGSISNQDTTGGSSLDLRGLGPDATLTLLNGRRMSYGGFTQMVDISAIPVEAVDRIEIVPDGASAIYGSDAVGGVANVILKRDFEGVTVGARYGGATDGGLITREYNVTAGTTWATGGFIAAGEKASSDPIYADQRDYTQSMFAPATLYSGNDLRSGLLSIHQSLGDATELRLDALRTVRNMTSYIGYSNVYLLSTPKTITSLVSPSVEFSLPNDWTLNVGGTWGEDDTDYYQSTVLATGTSLNGVRYGNKSRTYEVGAEGPLLALPGGDARIAVGTGYRYNDFLDRSLITRAVAVNGDDSSRFAYAELNLPFISPDLDITGIHRLEFTGALRSEDYNSFGRVTTPKLGLIYDPSADVTFKASWGKSFKVPTLLEQYEKRDVALYPASSLGGTGYASDATVLLPYGGNPGLGPEKAHTWNTSLAFHPEMLPGLEAELTWFDIDYTHRVIVPITSNAAEALNIPGNAPFIEYSPTATEQADILATFMLQNFAGAAYDPSKVVAIIHNQYTNASRQRIKGIDLSGTYRADLAIGRLTVRGSASWLDSAQQTTAAQSPYDLSGTLFNPARIKSRIGAVWQQGGFTASLFGNYKNGVIDTANGRKGSSFTTFDATLRYDTGARADAWSNLALELSAQNLFNRAPPLFAVTALTYAPYDSTNYSAIGRYLSLSVSKHW